jgi:hypothetical protein
MGWLIKVLISIIPTSGGLDVLRVLRILRVLRLVSMVPQMRKIVMAHTYTIENNNYHYKIYKKFIFNYLLQKFFHFLNL